MKNSDRRNRFTQRFDPVAPKIFNLPLGGKILQGNVILTGQIVVSGGTTSGTVVGEGGPERLIRRIKVIAIPAQNSRYPGGNIVDCSPRSLLRYAIAQHSGKFIGAIAGDGLGNGAAGTYNVYLSIPIYWADANLRRQVQTALNADPTAYQTIQVEVDTGTLSDCFAGNDRVVDWSGLQVQWADERENFSGDTFVRYQEDHTFYIQQANTRTLDNAMPQDGAFESLYYLAEQGASLTLADTILNRVSISGTTIDFDLYAHDIRQQMFDDEWFDPSQTAAGQYYIDFTDGLVGGSVPAGGLQIQLDLNNPSGAGLDDLLVYTRRLFSPANFTPPSVAK
ncbi:MAG TPA: hypothetical protein VHB45_14310 [Alloacidobacterium sp.]|nr:hypothetical protein [Alloacidobacterium sp.]